MTFCTCSN